MYPAEAISQLSDERLVASLRQLVRRGNRLNAEVVAHLAEVEARELHLEAACSSMHAYCTRVLGFDDAAAYNRILVARLARRLPAVLKWLADGRVHLTGLRLLAPHLREDNHRELLEQAAGKSKRQIEALVAGLAPKPDVPDRVRKRPRQRVEIACPGASSAARAGGGEAARATTGRAGEEPRRCRTEKRRDKAEPRAADRYKVEFSASAELVDRLERVRALMAHRKPGCGFEAVVGGALELLEAKLLKERFGVGAKPPRRKTAKRRGANKVTRHVPRAVRREVYERDGLGCAYVDPQSGRQCGEAVVELQHHRAYALGGEHSANNASLYCPSHNRYAARKDFGQERVEAAIRRERARREARGTRAVAVLDAELGDSSRGQATQLGLFGG